MPLVGNLSLVVGNYGRQIKASHTHKAVAVFNLLLLELGELRVCMLWCNSALYAQHNSYKLWTK